MKVLIGGGSGFIGKALTNLLRGKGHEVTIISRKPGPGQITWDDVAFKGLPPCDGVVNLAGENLMNPLRWWNEEFKKDLISSRLNTTKTLVKAMVASDKLPNSWVLVTGVGYYKPSETLEYTEDSEGGDFDFLSQLVTEWEAAGRLPEDQAKSVRQVVIRSGIVLGKDGGAMKQMIWPFWLGLGGILGTGHQPFPWIHVADMAGIILHCLEPKYDVSGILNGVAPATDTNAVFTHALGTVLRRPTIFPVPSFAIGAIFGNERGSVLLQGQKVIPRRTLESGYIYKYPELQTALKNIVS
ncbi:epimerase family protein SDR39U1 isoform X1 [Erpetoichthys calabaricus]|uniref:Short chain dehydrogenase/reductase family 39U, member 1 n=1 Tax=Erpetoichthys calabaricus TaxID=27687 RepID=A0A8C4RH02_ERPCA|nr:epimerase family protein SDR39U1 isoform X1 [Erpetoichthys calabaricus]